ncbi:MAG: hypothetical protein ACR2LE_06730 [Nocardioidaceae bacterium]
MRPEAVVCDRTAAWLWGVDAFAFRELNELPPIDVRATNGTSRIRRAEVQGIRRSLWTVPECLES